MFISLVVANSLNGVIGINGCLPWNIPEDLKRFRKLTDNSIVIMGRKTYESIGKPLENRYNFVISSKDLSNSDIYSFKDINSAIKYAEEKLPGHNVFVIGGASIYQQFLEQNLIDRIYQTIVKKNVDGDTFFRFNRENWRIVHNQDSVECSFTTWDKTLPL